MAKIFGSMVTSSNHQRRRGVHGVTQCKRSSRAFLRYRALELQLYLVPRHYLNPHHAMPPCHLSPLSPQTLPSLPHRRGGQSGSTGAKTSSIIGPTAILHHRPPISRVSRPTALATQSDQQTYGGQLTPSPKLSPGRQSCPFRVHSNRCNHVTASTGSSNGTGVSSISSRTGPARGRDLTNGAHRR